MNIRDYFMELRRRYPRPLDRKQRLCKHPVWRPSVPFKVRRVGDAEWTVLNDDQEICIECGFVRRVGHVGS